MKLLIQDDTNSYLIDNYDLKEVRKENWFFKPKYRIKLTVRGDSFDIALHFKNEKDRDTCYTDFINKVVSLNA